MQNSFSRNVLKGITKRFSKKSDAAKLSLSWLDVKTLKHLSPGKQRTFKYNHKQIVYINPQELLHSLDEIFVDEIYKADLPSKPYIIDCGANIGLSVLYFKEEYPDADIVAFEPDPANFSLLKTNISGLNGVEIREQAVWTEKKTLSFSSHGNMSSRMDENSVSGTIAVQAERLKDLLVRQVDFLKIDIEGAEYAVLKDIQPELGNVHRMFFEYHGNFDQNDELTEIFHILTASGFKYYIREAAPIFQHPFLSAQQDKPMFDIQLNIFCFR